MVGHEEGDGYRCPFHPRLRCGPRRRSIGTAGISFSECCYWSLESEPFADGADAKDQAAAVKFCKDVGVRPPKQCGYANCTYPDCPCEFDMYDIQTAPPEESPHD